MIPERGEAGDTGPPRGVAAAHPSHFKSIHRRYNTRVMAIDRAGLPFIAAALGLAALAWWLGGHRWAIAPAVLALFFAFFFRDPERAITAGRDLVLAPADGRVMAAGNPTGEKTPPGRWQQVTIFLSPFDVHINRMPVSGRVEKVEYKAGRFLPAYRRESGDLNELTEVWVNHGGQPIVVRQVVGVLARRIVCRVTPGDMVEAGQRFGLMKFGSRMDLFLPPTATLRVRVGDRVTGGISVLATLAGK